MAGNFGPDNKQALDLSMTHPVSVRPGGRLRFRFSLEAFNENAAVIYTADTFDKVIERGHFRGLEDWEFENASKDDAGFVITGWHKNFHPLDPEVPMAYEPWFQSIMKVFIETDKTVSVGFEDINDSARDYNDMLVTVNIFQPPPPPPPPSLRSYVFVGMGPAFVAGTALGLRLTNITGSVRSAGTRLIRGPR